MKKNNESKFSDDMKHVIVVFALIVLCLVLPFSPIKWYIVLFSWAISLISARIWGKNTVPFCLLEVILAAVLCWRCWSIDDRTLFMVTCALFGISVIFFGLYLKFIKGATEQLDHDEI